MKKVTKEQILSFTTWGHLASPPNKESKGGDKFSTHYNNSYSISSPLFTITGILVKQGLGIALI